MGGMILESVSEILEWNDPENQGGVVAHMTKFMNKDAGTGKESKKTSVIISTVKWIDGERSSQS